MPDRRSPVAHLHIVTLSQEYAGGWRWVCSCGAESRKAIDRMDAARNGGRHVDRQAKR